MHKIQLLAVNVQTDPQLFLLQISFSINIVVIPDLKWHNRYYFNVFQSESTFICWHLYPSNTTSSVSKDHKEVYEEVVVFWPVATLPPLRPLCRPFQSPWFKEGGEWANGAEDFESIFTRISDSERAFNGSGDPSIAVDYRFIQFFFGGGGVGWDFGLCMS